MLDRTEIDEATSQENSFTQRRKMDEKSSTVEPQPHLFNKNELKRWQRKRLEKQRHMGKRCRHTTKPDLHLTSPHITDDLRSNTTYDHMSSMRHDTIGGIARHPGRDAVADDRGEDTVRSRMFSVDGISQNPSETDVKGQHGDGGR